MLTFTRIHKPEAREELLEKRIENSQDYTRERECQIIDSLRQLFKCIMNKQKKHWSAMESSEDFYSLIWTIINTTLSRSVPFESLTRCNLDRRSDVHRLVSWFPSRGWLPLFRNCAGLNRLAAPESNVDQPFESTSIRLLPIDHCRTYHPRSANRLSVCWRSMLDLAGGSPPNIGRWSHCWSGRWGRVAARASGKETSDREYDVNIISNDTQCSSHFRCNGTASTTNIQDATPSNQSYVVQELTNTETSSMTSISDGTAHRLSAWLPGQRKAHHGSERFSLRVSSS